MADKLQNPKPPPSRSQKPSRSSSLVSENNHVRQHSSHSDHSARELSDSDYTDRKKRSQNLASSGHSSDSYGEMPPLESSPPRYPNDVLPVRMEKLERKLAKNDQKRTQSDHLNNILLPLSPVVREKLEVSDIPHIPLPESATRVPSVGRGQNLLNKLQIISPGASQSERESEKESGREEKNERTKTFTPTLGRGTRNRLISPVDTLKPPQSPPVILGRGKSNENTLIQDKTVQSPPIIPGRGKPLSPNENGLISQLDKSDQSPPTNVGRGKFKNSSPSPTKNGHIKSMGRGSLQFLPSPPSSSHDESPPTASSASASSSKPLVTDTSKPRGRGMVKNLIQVTGWLTLLCESINDFTVTFSCY